MDLPESLGRVFPNLNLETAVKRSEPTPEYNCIAFGVCDETKCWWPITVAAVFLTRSRLLLFVTDPSIASAMGINVDRWAMVESLWLGLTVGISIRATGMLYTFGSLVLPGLVAKHVSREVRPMFFVAPLVALAANTLGFVLANYYDFPPGQMVVALLCAGLLAAWSVRRLRG